ncbi:growth hormone-inducible transmembrane protein [Trichonephila clavipes]|nr:growth hormone-inducible transmembrane protein [Trichonephila clavipes]
MKTKIIKELAGTRDDQKKRLQAAAFENYILWEKFCFPRVETNGATCHTAGLWVVGATFAAMIGSGMIVRSIPYTEGFGAKQLAWMAHSGIMGAVVAPLCFLGGPILIRAAWYTAGVVGGLSTVAACAPSEKFLYMGGPLACGLGVVFAASLGSMFLPPTTALGAGLYSISMYGGLVLFGAFLLYDTQRIVHHAENHPMYAYKPYDPVNASISIYLDTLNIFIRIAMLLAGGGSRRK